jgi:HSP20 family protein
MTLRDLIQRGQSVPVSIIKGYDPYLFQGEMNRLFNDFFKDNGWPIASKSSVSVPALDITENDQEYKVTAELPGMDSENVEISVEGNYLILRGEKQEEKEENEESYLRRERLYGSFQRTIALPEIAEVSDAKASFKKGVLTITIPKKKETTEKSKRIVIEEAA